MRRRRKLCRSSARFCRTTSASIPRRRANSSWGRAGTIWRSNVRIRSPARRRRASSSEQRLAQHVGFIGWHREKGKEDLQLWPLPGCSLCLRRDSDCICMSPSSQPFFTGLIFLVDIVLGACPAAARAREHGGEYYLARRTHEI